MATVNIYNGYSVDMLNWNFSKAAQYGIASWIHSNINIYGTNYASAYEVEMNINGAFFDDIFAGNFTTNASGAVTGGTISAIYEQAWNGYAWVLAESFTGFSYSAVAIYNAAISGGAIGDYTD